MQELRAGARGERAGPQAGPGASSLDQAELAGRARAAPSRGRRGQGAAAATPDEHDYSEAETRDFFIDLLLAEAGWTLDQARDREFEVTGHARRQGAASSTTCCGATTGCPLAVVEAKRTRRDAKVGQQQAKLYADCLEAAVRSAAGDLLHERLRALALGRRTSTRPARSAASTRRTSSSC